MIRVDSLQFQRTFGWVLLAGIVCSAVVGCGRGPRLYRVSGNATFAGNPIPVGKIYFTPDGSKENAGPAGYAEIRNGKYDTSASGGQGIIGGPMVVKIEGNSGAEAVDDNSAAPPLFPPYETTADLPKSSTTKDFDVPADAAHPKPQTEPKPAPGV
jgi:hypothetical protein